MAVVLVAVAAASIKYWAYIANPWTRDGQVRAPVIQIMPRVSGPIVDVLINDNQLVNAGELLFRINPRTLRSAVDQAQSGLHQAQVEAKNAK